jgi:hypothetical protein
MHIKLLGKQEQTKPQIGGVSFLSLLLLLT